MVRIDLNNKTVRKDMEYIYNSGIDWNEISGKSFYITGAYGMLASYFVAFLCYLNNEYRANITIYANGRSEKKMRDRFGDLLENNYFHQLYSDIVNRDSVVPNVEYIVHAAGAASPDTYATIPVEVAEANAIGVYNLLTQCKDRKIKGALIFSSADIYGKVDACPRITEDVCGKMDPLELHSCYGESKRMAETWCSLFYYEYGVPTKIARIGHTFGPTMDVENDPRVFASFMKCILDGKDIEMLSDGRAKRPFCYIADAIVGYFLVLLKGENGNAYNVCNTSEFLSIKELAEILVDIRCDIKLSVKALERKVDEDYVENTSNQENCPVEDKLTKLGWSHKISTKEGFSRVYDYLCCQRMM